MPKPAESVEKRAIHKAVSFYERGGFEVSRVSGQPGHGGYDLLVARGRKRLKIEVKGCRRLWGIPDLYGTEIGRRNRLVADYLCVVYFLQGKAPFVCEIPKAAIPPEMVVPKPGYRIRSPFKKQGVLERYCLGKPQDSARFAQR